LEIEIVQKNAARKSRLVLALGGGKTVKAILINGAKLDGNHDEIPIAFCMVILAAKSVKTKPAWRNQFSISRNSLA
jgi:hypothetical protein